MQEGLEGREDGKVIGKTCFLSSLLHSFCSTVCTASNFTTQLHRQSQHSLSAPCDSSQEPPEFQPHTGVKPARQHQKRIPSQNPPSEISHLKYSKSTAKIKGRKSVPVYNIPCYLGQGKKKKRRIPWGNCVELRHQNTFKIRLFQVSPKE